MLRITSNGSELMKLVNLLADYFYTCVVNKHCQGKLTQKELLYLIYKLGALKDRRSAEVLRALAAHDPDSLVREASIKALMQFDFTTDAAFIVVDSIMWDSYEKNQILGLQLLAMAMPRITSKWVYTIVSGKLNELIQSTDSNDIKQLAKILIQRLPAKK